MNLAVGDLVIVTSRNVARFGETGKIIRFDNTFMGSMALVEFGNMQKGLYKETDLKKV